jgi:FkbH-like protein
LTDENEIKCVVWDLDRTLWEGILSEGDPIRLRPRTQEILDTLDRRGILHSVASKNDFQPAMKMLESLEVSHYFICPQISWNAKSAALSKIRESLNIQMDSILFIDDDPYERDEVSSEHPDIICVDAARYGDLLQDPRLQPRFITEDSPRRRQLYLNQIEREQAEGEFQGPRKEFLASLGMSLTIARATESDLQRAQELTVRTNQLNSTGRTYGYDELIGLLDSPRHELLLCQLEDCYGHHGKIGLALIETIGGCDHLRLLLMSCRVMSLGLGSVLLSYVMRRARIQNRSLRADFRRNDRNRQMYVTFRLSNFKEISSGPDGSLELGHDLAEVPDYPDYLVVSEPVP